jgi:hypothetical protein
MVRLSGMPHGNPLLYGVFVHGYHFTSQHQLVTSGWLRLTKLRRTVNILVRHDAFLQVE